MCINYKLYDNNAVINFNYGRLEDLILLFKIPMGKRKIFSKFIDNLCTRPQKNSPVLV